MEKYLNETDHHRIKDTKYHLLVDEFCLVEGPDHVEHNFTFMQGPVSIPIFKGEMRLSLWMAYLASCHKDIKITPLTSLPT